MATPKTDAILLDGQVIEELVHNVRSIPSAEALVSELGVSLYVSGGYHHGHDTLVHLLAETSYYELTRSQGAVTNETWWSNSGKTLKIREVQYIRTGGQISQEIWQQYNAEGILQERLTITYTRAGGNIVSATYVFLA